MRRDQFDEFRDRHYLEIVGINTTKGRDYAGGDEDALANFKAAAEQLGVSPYTIWAVYAHKHWSAVMSFVRAGGQVESEPIEGRLHDVILYCFLLLGLIEDAKGEPPSPWDILKSYQGGPVNDVTLDRIRGELRAAGYGGDVYWDDRTRKLSYTEPPDRPIAEWVCAGVKGDLHGVSRTPVGETCEVCGRNEAGVSA